VASTAAVFFDVDFTLIHPGPRFQGQGYRDSCAECGVEVNPDLFNAAVRAAAGALDSADQLYDTELFVGYTRRIIEGMGGRGPGVETVARRLYDEWAHHHHFSLYDDVPATLRDLASAGLRLGVISNSHRCLVSFRSHFDLDQLITVAVSSPEHGYMKPHPSIFQAALEQARVRAAEAVMVGDSLPHDVEGARSVGMRGVLLARGLDGDGGPDVIRSLIDLRALLERA
jgi:HAD superfamily hydrolase (TIGR01662 family)